MIFHFFYSRVQILTLYFMDSQEPVLTFVLSDLSSFILSTRGHRKWSQPDQRPALSRFETDRIREERGEVSGGGPSLGPDPLHPRLTLFHSHPPDPWTPTRRCCGWRAAGHRASGRVGSDRKRIWSLSEPQKTERKVVYVRRMFGLGQIQTLCSRNVFKLQAVARRNPSSPNCHYLLPWQLNLPRSSSLHVFTNILLT